MTVRNARQGDVIKFDDGSGVPARATVHYLTLAALFVIVNESTGYTQLTRNGCPKWPLWNNPEVQVR
jgi:hypothetical protein